MELLPERMLQKETQDTDPVWMEPGTPGSLWIRKGTKTDILLTMTRSQSLLRGFLSVCHKGLRTYAIPSETQ